MKILRKHRWISLQFEQKRNFLNIVQKPDSIKKKLINFTTSTHKNFWHGSDYQNQTQVRN